ncbi:response regulator [Rugamonas sp. FT82W]|uniref:Response regulator n=1 Tax=Duganella vulcania TaxID=2692166 RepID=A0A845G4Z5_9BURK|nr:response regulator [Duganella vulcania]
MDDSTSVPRITILTVDDHPVFRNGIAGVIADAPDLLLIAEASSGAEALLLHRKFRPDVTLMDIQMPDMNGIDATQLIREEFPEARIVILTTHQGDVHALRAIKAGAAGYLLKGMLPQDLLQMIRSVHSGQRRVAPMIASNLARQVKGDLLSPREVQVLQLVGHGNTNNRISTLLQISEETVKVHMRNILAKLAANDRTHAVLIAIQRGILEVSPRCDGDPL